MSWASRSQPIRVGDRVCYSRRFLQSISCYTGEMPFARGEVTALVPMGETTLAEIAWDRDGLPDRVNAANLARVTARGVMEPG